MKLRHVTLLALTALTVGACSKKKPVAVPTNDDAVAAEALARARADSIAAAEAAARRDREARERAAAAARTREMLTEMIFFDYDSEQLRPDAQDNLREKVAILRANPTLELRIEGHADERGSTEYNIALGQRRAETVRNFLATYGISSDRVVTMSYGKERPLLEGSGESVWSRNRRAEFIVTAGEIAVAGPEGR
jgi:peptidoglycan-associated lipoprotein